MAFAVKNGAQRNEGHCQQELQRQEFFQTPHPNPLDSFRNFRQFYSLLRGRGEHPQETKCVSDEERDELTCHRAISLTDGTI